jgi:hypothetical protein
MGFAQRFTHRHGQVAHEEWVERFAKPIVSGLSLMRLQGKMKFNSRSNRIRGRDGVA